MTTVQTREGAGPVTWMVRDEVTSLLSFLRSSESGLTPEDADLADDLEIWLDDMTIRDKEAETGHRDYRDAKGRKLPGVTGVIGSTLGWSKEGLTRWAAKEAAQEAAQAMMEGAAIHDAIRRARFAPFSKRDKAGDYGTIVHGMVASFLRGIEVEDDLFIDEETMAAARAGFERFRKWFDPEKYEVMRVEHALTDRELGYGGTMDIVLLRKVDSVIIVVDLKTGKGVYDEQVIQLGAYASLLARCEQVTASEGMLVHIPRDGDLRDVPVSKEMLFIGTCSFGALLLVHKNRKALALKKENQ